MKKFRQMITQALETGFVQRSRFKRILYRVILDMIDGGFSKEEIETFVNRRLVELHKVEKPNPRQSSDKYSYTVIRSFLR